jgi:Transposase DDE domain
MRRSQSTLTASDVHAHARKLLIEHVGLRDYKKSVPARLLASLLLLAACWQTSLSGVCHIVPGAPSHETVRKALLNCLPPKPSDLRRRLLAALRDTLPEHLLGHDLIMAIDLNQRPYYGKTTRGTTKREKKKSTRKSFTWATLAVLTSYGRFTVGLLLTRPTMRHTTIIEELLAQAEEAGLRVSYLLLDKDFYSAEVIEWLQKHNVPFVVPAQKRGKKPGRGNYDFFQPDKEVGWYDYTWTTPRRRWDAKKEKRREVGTVTVTVRLCVARRPRLAAEPEPRLVYACWGVGRWPPAEMVRTYRKRFGIESSYRQLGECLGRTSSRDERVRLLLVGVALLLCNLWAYLHSEVFAEGALGERRLHLEALRLPTLRLALVFAIAAETSLVLKWPTQRPLPDRFTMKNNC